MEIKHDIAALESQAKIIRRSIIEMSHACGRNAHPGPALSIADICTALYYDFMNIDPAEHMKADRDRLVLSKGHACPVIYAELAELGFFSKDLFPTLRHPGSMIQGHPTFHKTPGVDMTSGSLGNGLGIGLGMAYYLRLKGFDSRVYVILGDGEMNEGTVWEAVNYAPVQKLDNLIAIVDQNRFQSCGATGDILPMENMAERWRAFGWNVLEIDGHDMEQIVSALGLAKAHTGSPTCIVAKTVKGKGVSFMENNNAWHQKPVTDEEYAIAMKELEG